MILPVYFSVCKDLIPAFNRSNPQGVPLLKFIAMSTSPAGLLALPEELLIAVGKWLFKDYFDDTPQSLSRLSRSSKHQS